MVNAHHWISYQIVSMLCYYDHIIVVKSKSSSIQNGCYESTAKVLRVLRNIYQKVLKWGVD